MLKSTTSQARPSSTSQLHKRKGPNWSQQEKLDLVAEVGKRRSILRSRSADSVTKEAKQAAWREVIAVVNASLTSSKERSKAEVKKQWQNLLERAKKERQLLLDAQVGELNGANIELSLISQRVLDVASESVTDKAALDVDANSELLELRTCLEEECGPEVILGTFEVDHRVTAPCHAAGGSSQRSGPLPAANNCVPLPTTSTLHNRFRDRRRNAAAASSGCFVAGESQRDLLNESLQGLFFESALQTCKEVSDASKELVRMQKKEHTLKMALLRSKNKYYELKIRKLQFGDAS